MADSKISALPNAAALAGSEAIPAVQAGGNVSLTPAQMLSYVLGNAATTEQVQDIVGGFMAGGTGIAVTYNDAANTLTVASSNPKANTTTSDPGAAADSGAGYATGSTWTNAASGVRWFCVDATSAAAVWLPQGALATPAYVSGRNYPAAHSATPSAQAMAADTLYAMPIVITRRVTISALVARVTTAATGNMRMGIYADGGGAPGAKVAEVATTPSTGSAGTLSAALPGNLALLPGTYWLATIFSAAPSVYAIGSDQSLASLLGGTTLSIFSGTLGPSGVTGSSTYAAGLPASFGTAMLNTAGASPLLGITVA